jgi:hypothetical protein
MQDHALRVGEELVIQGQARLTILAVEDNEVVLGIADDRVDQQSFPGGIQGGGGQFEAEVQQVALALPRPERGGPELPPGHLPPVRVRADPLR